MRATVFGILCLFVGCTLPQNAWSQSQAARALQFAPSTSVTTTPANEVQEARGEMMRLPALNDLIDVARKLSPNQKYLDKAAEIEQQKRKIFALADYKPLSINADAFRGNQDVFSLNSDGGLIRPSATVQNRTNTQASVTLRLIPADIFINKANRRIHEIEIERMSLLADQNAQTYAGEIAYLHGMTEKALDLMDLFAEGAEVMLTNAEMGKRLYQQGAMTLADYSGVLTSSVEATAKFENAKGEFRLYYQMLMTKVYGRVP